MINKPMTFERFDELGIPRYWTAKQYQEFKQLVSSGQTKEKSLEIVFGLPRTSVLMPPNTP